MHSYIEYSSLGKSGPKLHHRDSSVVTNYNIEMLASLKMPKFYQNYDVIYDFIFELENLLGVKKKSIPNWYQIVYRLLVIHI